MPIGLSVADVVNVQVLLSPLAVPVRNFGAFLIAGPTDVIDVNQRVRQYTTLTAVASDFGTTAPEYYSAAAFFSQVPQPAVVYIGRWAQTGTAGVLYGGNFTATQQAALITSLNAISAGSMAITVDGTVRSLTTLDFSTATTLNGVAGIIGTALTQATVTWDAANGRFQIKSKTSGTTSSVSYATTAGSGTDVSALLKLTAATGAQVPIAGIAAETPAACAAILAGQRGDWYGLMFAPANAADITNVQYQAVAAFIEGASPYRTFWVTTQDANTLSPTSTTDLGYTLSSLKYNRTIVQYSSGNLYAVASLAGRGMTVDFTGNNTMITLDFKVEPGIAAETISETAAAALIAKNVNVFVNYMNGAAIIQPGVTSSGMWYDVIFGTDWYANAVQTALFNALYTTPTKIPQTEAGINVLVAAAEQVGDQAVRNGLLFPGIWNGPPLGSLATGQAMTKGYYTYTVPLALQSQADRAARKSPVIQQAIKLSGAVQSVNAIITVNQ